MAHFYMIHLPSVVEREPYIQSIKSIIGPNELQIIPASDGHHWKHCSTFPMNHPHSGKPTEQGNIGLVETLFKIFEDEKMNSKPFIVFEDDCRFYVPWLEVEEYIEKVDLATQGAWDIILLGANEYVESSYFTSTIRKVQRFWGTHAMVIKPTSLATLLEGFTENLENGIFLPADWMYNIAIKQKGLRCYGPFIPNLYCAQIPGLVSSITGNVRK